VKEPFLSDGEFLKDVGAARESGHTFHLWWLGQSGFLLMHDFQVILIDPCLSDSLTVKYAASDKPHVRMTRRVVDPNLIDGVNVITTSHNHTDHLDAETIRPVLVANPSAIVVAPEANREFVLNRLGAPASPVRTLDRGRRYDFGTMSIVGVPAAHEELSRDEGGRHPYLGYLFQMHGWTIYHSGDTVLYDGMVEHLRPYNIDVALLPINGRAPERRVAGNLSGAEAARLAKDVGAKVVIPCHYDMFEFNTADPNEEFVPECERIGQAYRVLRQGERFSSTEVPS
jgi:L-ascorbate metabolism protein UlaG (beta-lactamase superfamily)